MNGFRVLLMLMISSVLVLLCGCSGGGGSSLANLPGVVQPTIVASASPTPGSTASPGSADNPTGSPSSSDTAAEEDPEGSPGEEVSPEEGSPAEDSGGSGGTTTPPGSAPSGEEEPSPEPISGSIPGNPGSDPTADLLPEDELDRLFPNLPPDPGEEGKRTLEGIDADGDGVRDDVQRWIYRRYPNDELKRKAMLQYARAVQADLLVANRRNRQLSRQRTEEIFQAQSCGRSIFGGEEFELKRREIQILILNTRERVEADIQASYNVSGEVFAGSNNSGCLF